MDLEWSGVDCRSRGVEEGGDKLQMQWTLGLSESNHSLQHDTWSRTYTRRRTYTWTRTYACANIGFAVLFVDGCIEREERNTHNLYLLVRVRIL